uniref:Complexin-1 n=1 Tax=Rhinolophus ferrumequinum TaxID=59479 RepID=A0A671FAJ7_RHIFE
MEFVMKQALGGATKDMGKMLGGDEEKDPDAAKKEEERQEALRQEEEERKAKYAKMEAEREAMRQGIRDKNHTGDTKAPAKATREQQRVARCRLQRPWSTQNPEPLNGLLTRPQSCLSWDDDQVCGQS